MSKIPKTKEYLARYMMPSITFMEFKETFIGRAMKQPNIQKKLSLRVICSEVEPK